MLEEEKEPDRRTWRIRFDVDRLAGRVEHGAGRIGSAAGVNAVHCGGKGRAGCCLPWSTETEEETHALP